MVHQTIPNSKTRAPKASSKISTMKRLLCKVVSGAIVGTLLGCASAPTPIPAERAPTPPSSAAGSASSAGLAESGLPVLVQAKSRWIAVPWTQLPGFGQDALHEAWNAWLRSCERPATAFVALCPEVRRLSIGSADEQLSWITSRLQPYRVEALVDEGPGLLTGYFEPMFEASRLPGPGFSVPLYQAPVGLAQRKPWYSRQEIDTLPAAQAALKGREIAYLADPVDALILQIQGSGRLRVTEPDGQQRLLRVAYAATNEQPYRSVGRWLLEQGAVRDASWPGIRAWIAQNPQRVQEMLWSNPRMVFFREEPLSELDAGFGPRGAQGVALTPGRSIAVDPTSIPYGTPVWLASSGPVANLEKLVLAQDTGSAIVGAVRADYFAGWGAQAGELAGRLKQPLRMWVLWPRSP
ncbi:murein transglycosylase A [Rhodoferax sp.]|uniref:murein transglycosylase A n=1 Tax=Rhodoferax sp. TaxID=50421 RepID=UPI00275C7257|nr:MltA domain-containing protein [Rhodoferax sp.]